MFSWALFLVVFSLLSCTSLFFLYISTCLYTFCFRASLYGFAASCNISVLDEFVESRIPMRFGSFFG